MLSKMVACYFCNAYRVIFWSITNTFIKVLLCFCYHQYFENIEIYQINRLLKLGVV